MEKLQTKKQKVLSKNKQAKIAKHEDRSSWVHHAYMGDQDFDIDNQEITWELDNYDSEGGSASGALRDSIDFYPRKHTGINTMTQDIAANIYPSYHTWSAGKLFSNTPTYNDTVKNVKRELTKQGIKTTKDLKSVYSISSEPVYYAGCSVDTGSCADDGASIDDLDDIYSIEANLSVVKKNPAIRAGMEKRQGIRKNDAKLLTMGYDAYHMTNKQKAKALGVGKWVKGGK